jgi:hypothetical protein
MNTAVTAPAIEVVEQSAKHPQGAAARPLEIDVKQTLNLRHETAFAWVMPEGWEPLHS